MALTLDAEQKMRAVGLETLYIAHQAVWDDAARQAKAYIRSGFPQGAAIRRDDVAKALEPVLEVNQTLIKLLNTKKLKQKYWFGYFADLIIDRAWDTLDA